MIDRNIQYKPLNNLDGWLNSEPYFTVFAAGEFLLKSQKWKLHVGATTAPSPSRQKRHDLTECNAHLVKCYLTGITPSQYINSNVWLRWMSRGPFLIAIHPQVPENIIYDSDCSVTDTHNIPDNEDVLCLSNGKDLTHCFHIWWFVNLLVLYK